MTPLAEKAFTQPMPKAQMDAVRSILAGAQYFECSALAPVVALRAAMPGDWDCKESIIECELPAERTWIDYGELAIALSRDRRGYSEEGNTINLTGILLNWCQNAGFGMLEFYLFEDGSVGVRHAPGFTKVDSFIDACSGAINTAWYCIEAMNAAGGFCHSIKHAPSRQQKRASARQGKPCHKWVEVRLGRNRPRNASSEDGTLGRTVAYHYRRAHPVNHPNPNYPKWRAGGWVGDVSAGIRSHTYVLEVPA